MEKTPRVQQEYLAVKQRAEQQRFGVRWVLFQRLDPLA